MILIGRTITPMILSAPGLVLLSPAMEKERRVSSSRQTSSIDLLVKLVASGLVVLHLIVV